MHIEHQYLKTASRALGALSLLLPMPALPSPAQAPHQSAAVPLVTDACPVVHPGDRIVFEWNPVFDPDWPVTGLGSVVLQFGRMDEDGVNLVPRYTLKLGGRVPAVSIAAMPNGFYRVEVAVQTDRTTQPGVYRLVGASMNARTDSDYSGAAPQMMRSPVEQRFCITLRSTQ